MVPRSLFAACALLAAATTGYGALPGQTLVAEVFVRPQDVDVALVDFPQFHLLTPDLEIGVETMSFQEADFATIKVGGVPLTEKFGMRIRGSLWVATAGSHIFYLTSDDGSLLMLDGNQEIDNGGVHSTVSQKVTLQMTRGWHTIEVHYFQGALDAGLQLEWTTPTTPRAMIPANSYGPPVTPAPPAPALVADVFVRPQDVDVTLVDFPQFHLLTPDLVMDVQTVSFQKADFFAIEVGGVPLTKKFGMRIHGSLWVATAGSHTFYMTSDDGSRLMLDGEQVIDNGGVRPTVSRKVTLQMTTREVTLELTQGWHAIEVHYFQAVLDAGLRLEWTTPTTPRAVIPASCYGPPDALVQSLIWSFIAPLVADAHGHKL